MWAKECKVASQGDREGVELAFSCIRNQYRLEKFVRLSIPSHHWFQGCLSHMGRMSQWTMSKAWTVGWASPNDVITRYLFLLFHLLICSDDALTASVVKETVLFTGQDMLWTEVAEVFHFSKHTTYQRQYVFTWFYRFPQNGSACVCMRAFLLGYLFFTEWEGGMKGDTQWSIPSTYCRGASLILACCFRNEPQVFSCFFWYKESWKA